MWFTDLNSRSSMSMQLLPRCILRRSRTIAVETMMVLAQFLVIESIVAAHPNDSLSKLNGQPLNFHAGATDMSAQAVKTRRKPL